MSRCSESPTLREFGSRPVAKNLARRGLRRSHPQDAEAGQPVDHRTRDVGPPIIGRRVELRVAKRSEFRQGGGDFRPFFIGELRIGQDQIGRQSPPIQPLGKASTLRP